MRRLIDEGREDREAKQRQDRLAFSRIGWALLAFAVTTWGLQLLIQVAAMIWVPSWLQSQTFYWIVSFAPMYLVGVPIFARILRPLPDAAAPELVELSPLQMLAFLCITFSMSILGGYAANLLAALAQWMLGHPIPDPSASIDQFHPLATIFLVCGLAPILEELVFRGILLRKLRPYGASLSIFATAISFMLCHGNLYQSINILLVGIVFGYITVCSGTVWYSIILHMALNLIATLLPRLLATDHIVILFIASTLLLICLPVGLFLTWVGIRKRPELLHPFGLGTYFSTPGQIVFVLTCLVFIAASMLVTA